MLTHRPKRWSFKPPIGAQINWGHPLSIGLSLLILWNEGGGTRANSLIGNSYATTDASTSWINTIFGPALSGVGNSFANTLASPAVNITGPITLETLVYPKISNVYQALITSPGNSRDYSYYLSANGTGQIYLTTGGSAIGNVTVSPGWTVNAWNHIVFVADGTNWFIYINGVQSYTAANSAKPTGVNGQCWLGSEGSSFGLNGYIAKSAIYNQALNAAAVAALYADPWVIILPQASRSRIFQQAVIAAAGGSQYLPLIGVG